MDLDELEEWFDELAMGMERPGLPAPLQPHTKDAVQTILRADVLLNFYDSHDPEGTPYPPLKHPRSNSKGGDKVLIDIGLLLHSAGYSAQAADVDEVPGGVRVTFDDELLMYYGNFQRLGTRTIPAREFLGISEHATENIADVVVSDTIDQLLK